MRSTIHPVLTLLFVGCSVLAGPGEAITLFVAPAEVSCSGVGPRSCLQVRESHDAEWENLFEPIVGFQFEPGFQYELRVRRTRVEPVAADGSSFRYELVRIVSKTPA